MLTPQPPIFVIEDLDVLLFKCVEEAQRFLEPWWVIEKRGVIFDALGVQLSAEIGAENASVTLKPDSSHASDLEKLLRNHLIALGEISAQDSECGLDSLVRRCIERHSVG
ncbi:hypothetical protein [Stenotrophobium rhamnosiphilum]|uniref:Uncharacterized protein n=1 Tax=Stenotrophobium rhamnosiphilum TaxID=2029166 RepID=A0A2T5MBP3_9GAMM|nr:hypothetical protein [Stenotrophobium rhamnosiphilum]PTU29146.1 hypothetical protein CJD38_17510 [Stenotrophobium rhamnosiphilum]